MKFTSVSRTMHWLIAHVKQRSCFIVKNPNSLLPTCGRPTMRTLNRLITAFGAMQEQVYIIRHVNTGRGRYAAEGDKHLGWLPAGCSRRNSWSVAKKTRCLHVFVHEEVTSTLVIRGRSVLSLRQAQCHSSFCHRPINSMTALDFNGRSVEVKTSYFCLCLSYALPDNSKECAIWLYGRSTMQSKTAKAVVGQHHWVDWSEYRRCGENNTRSWCLDELSEKTGKDGDSKRGRLLELWLFAIYYVPAGQ